MADGPNNLFSAAEAGKRGGKARARALSKEERKEIARQGALARWGEKPGVVAKLTLREAPLKVGPVDLECAVLEDETRVISERAFSRAIGAKRGGSHWKRLKRDPGASYLPVFMSAANLIPFIPKDLREDLASPIVYRDQEGRRGYGIRAEMVPDILRVWIRARDQGALTAAQLKFALIAETLLKGLGATGLVALIDEATGWQNLRPQDALAKILENYIAKDLRRWMRTFPVSFFRELCRMKGVPFREDMRLPQYFGHIVNDLVYDRLAPGVLDELRRKNPKLESGRRKAKHHQWLTEGIGNPSLLFHLGMIEGIAKGCADGAYDDFYARVTKALPKPVEAPLFTGPDPEAPDETGRRLPPPQTPPSEAS